MRHPFDGIIVPEQPSRRSWLRGLLAVLGGLVGVRSASAVAPPTRGKPKVEPSPEPPIPPTQAKSETGVTKALNEAGGKVPATLAIREGGISSAAAREEGGRLTTRALREEGAMTRRGGEGGASTRAVGEEGGRRITTLALGEEGGK